jgi:type III secretion protein Q
MTGLEPAELPAELLAAALALTFRPRLDRLAESLGWEIKMAEGSPQEDAGPDSLSFTLNFDQGGRVFRLPLRLTAEGETAHLALAEKVARFPAWVNPQSASWPVPVTLVAGRMNLAPAELAGLEVSDILLPPDYPAADGRLALSFSAGGGEFNLAIRSGRAEVLAGTTSEVKTVSEINPPPDMAPAEPAPESRPDPPEVVIAFELGKKLLPWSELAALAPGRSFPLDVDPLGQVTLTLHGRALAVGRLVDLGGALGVEITRLLEK